MKKAMTAALIIAMILILPACSKEVEVTTQSSPEATAPVSSNGLDGDVVEEPLILEDEEPPEEIPRTLERGEDGVLIGSIVFLEPVMLVGDFKDGETENNLINVRMGPNIESQTAGQINYRKVVEATEVVNGWYRVTVLSNNQSGMLTGFIRSDLLKEYSEEGTHNRTQLGSQVFEEPVLLVGAVSAANLRSGPGVEFQPVATIGLGQVAEATEVIDGWYHVTVFPGMFRGFVDSELLVEYMEDRQFFASTREDIIEWQGTGMEISLVDLRIAIPEIEYYIIFATPDNFTGNTQYARDIPILQSGTAEKLKSAQEIFARDGYTIKVYDAYRPSSVSGILSTIIADSRYIASAGSSIHNRAAAVDITLIDADGNELEMPSPMHTFNSTSHRDSSAMSEEARKNMDYMASVMRQCGFTTVSTEWWHFSDTNSSRYPPLDISFAEFEMYAIDR